MEKPISIDETRSEEPRDLGLALRKGWRCRCPNCGQGPLLKSYLTVRENCPVCREALYHQRADDGPAYLTILIVGHIVGPLLLMAYVQWPDNPLSLFVAFAVLTVGLSLYLLPRLKGMVVAFQWARHMHGFGHAP